MTSILADDKQYADKRILLAPIVRNSPPRLSGIGQGIGIRLRI